jgi:hypothetical protein
VKAQERPDEHDQPEDSDVLKRRLDGHCPDDVGRDQEFQASRMLRPNTVRTIR